MTEEQKAKRKENQHKAWLKWYEGPKGKAYYQKRKIREATVQIAPAGQMCDGCLDPNCKTNGCMGA